MAEFTRFGLEKLLLAPNGQRSHINKLSTKFIKEYRTRAYAASQYVSKEISAKTLDHRVYDEDFEVLTWIVSRVDSHLVLGSTESKRLKYAYASMY
jgi:transcriptional regulatory protein LevR